MNAFNKARIQASEIVSQAYDYVSAQYQQVGKVFTLASAYGQILSVLSQLSDMILFFIEDSTTEQNIYTASRTQSIVGLARLAGHNATRAVASTGEILLHVTKLPNVQGNQIIIPNYSRIKCLNNNKVYLLNLPQQEIRLSITGGKPYFGSVIQGEIQTQIFNGNNTPLQSFTAVTKGSVMVDNFFVNVYVNGEKWKKYDSLYDIPRKGKGYLVKTGISGGLDVYFGNDYAGMMPPSGSEIRVEYLLTSGEAGNIREGEDVSWQWIDSGYSLFGEEIDLNLVISTDMSQLVTFGSNPEPTALTRLIAPNTSRSFVFANPTNYIIFLEKFNYFSVVDAYTTFADQYIDDDNVIYLFLIPDVTKRLQNDENYFTLPQSYFTLTQQEESKVLNVIEDSGSKIVTTVVKIVDPILSRFVANITLVIFQGYSQDVIKSQIEQRLSDFFLGLRRRDRIPASDIVALIENIEGVDSVHVSFVSEKNENSKRADPQAPLVGLDEFGDIIIGRDELPLLRGGWKDRNGVYYEDAIIQGKASSVNIVVKSTSPYDLNAKLFQETVAKIKNS